MGDVAGEYRGLQRAFDAINSRDAEALLAELDPEVEWHGDGRCITCSRDQTP